MTEEYLSFSEIVEVLQDEKYSELIRTGSVRLILGMKDFQKHAQDKGINVEYSINMMAKHQYYEYSGLCVEDRNTHPCLKELNNGNGGKISESDKFFRTKEELIAFLDEYLKSQKYSYLDFSKYSKLPDAVSEDLKRQQEKLSDEQCASLVVYKSRMFQIMNFLWQQFGSVVSCDLEEIKEFLQKDCSALNDTYNWWLTDSEKIELKKASFFQAVVKDQLKFFQKALKNPENQEFFDKMPNMDFSDEVKFVSSIIEYMKVMEGIDCITMPSDVKLYRGVYGAGKLDKISSSIMASTTPNLSTAIGFALNYSNGTTGVGSKALVGLDVQKGTPIIPLMFSVKTSISGITAEDVEASGIDYDSLGDTDIKLEVVADEPNIQSEIVINTSRCIIPSPKDACADTLHMMQERTDWYELTFVTERFSDAFDLKRLLMDFECFGRCPITHTRPTYTNVFYPNVSVSSKIPVSEIQELAD